MIYGSLCSGIEAATTAWHPLGWKPAFFSEIEPFPSAVLAHHHPETPNLGDMLKFKDWPDYAIDLLVGGTPCQSFSIAGLRKGLDDPRGNLMLTFGAIAAKYRPRWLVWENVPGVLSSDDGRDFASLLGLLCGQKITVPEEGWRTAGIVAGISSAYGLAWRVLDAQYCRTQSHPRAVPQRRRRVFVVGYLGDWRRAAAVLFDRESMRGDSPPRREARQRPAPTLAARTRGGGGLGTDFDLDGGLTAVQCGEIVPQAMSSKWSKGSSGPAGDEVANLVAHSIAPPITSNPYGDHESRDGLQVAHSLTGEGFDASEDGSGRATPVVAVSSGRGWWDESEVGATVRSQESPNKADTLVAFDCKAGANTGFAIGDVPGALRGEGHGGGHAAVMTLAIRGRDGTPDIETREDGTANAILTPNGGRAGIGVGANCARMAVRRLTPEECEALQGFPRGYTAITVRGKTAADGPRYKALGNSMACNVMRFIGDRIAQVESLVLPHAENSNP